MRKIFKEIVASKLFVFVFILSVFAIVIHFIVYFNNVEKNDKLYLIDNVTEASECQENIDDLKDGIDELNPKDKYYESDKRYLEDEIKIYQELKENHIDYESVYDFGIGNDEEAVIYILNSDVTLKVILLVNMLIILYLCFTKDFDNSAYSLIYTDNRRKIVLKRIGCFFVCISILYLIYAGMICLLSLAFNQTLNNVLIIDNERAIIQNAVLYVFREFILENYYVLLFVSFILWTISFIMNKSLFTLGLFAFLLGIVFGIEYVLLPITEFFGLCTNYYEFTYVITNCLKFWILLPIAILGFGFRYFTKKNL